MALRADLNRQWSFQILFARYYEFPNFPMVVAESALATLVASASAPT
jgi:hypothetical protein